MLMLGSGMLGVFAARDIILFYIFFEFTLVPLYFLIGIWGHEERRMQPISFSCSLLPAVSWPYWG